jgi:peptidylprolyl isomerase
MKSLPLLLLTATVMAGLAAEAAFAQSRVQPSASQLTGVSPTPDPVKAPPLPANLTWRDPDPENILVAETSRGTIISELYPAVAPISVLRIKTLTRQHFYDGLDFFRVIEGFMDQTGDPQNTGEGGSTLADIKAEFEFRRGADIKETMVASDKPNTGFIGVMPMAGQSSAMMAISADGKTATHGLFCTGVLGIARAGDPDSGNSQFFFMRGANQGLDTKYTPFGRVVQGMDAVKSIKSGEPVTPPRDTVIRMRLLADIPAAERPKVKVMDTTTPAFTAYVDGLRAKAGGSYFDICDVDTQTPAS